VFVFDLHSDYHMSILGKLYFSKRKQGFIRGTRHHKLSVSPSFPGFHCSSWSCVQSLLINLAGYLLLSVRKFICTAYVKAPVSCYLRNYWVFLLSVRSILCSKDVCGRATLDVDCKFSETFAGTSGINTKSLFNHSEFFLETLFYPIATFPSSQNFATKTISPIGC
jgi:hypothetical protein